MKVTAPTVFELDDQGDLTLRYNVVPEDVGTMSQSAVERCPTEALSVGD